MVTTNVKYAVETFSLTKIFTDWWGRNKVLAVDRLNLQVKYNEVFLTDFGECVIFLTKWREKGRKEKERCRYLLRKIVGK